MVITFSDLYNLIPAEAILVLLVVGLLGAVFGSFINCAAWRITHGESVAKGRSHCATCNHELGALDLVPVFSWLLLRGKCRYCGEKISVRYTIAELVLAAYFISIFLVYGLGLHTLGLWILGTALLGLSLTDLEEYIIPNGFVITGIVGWLVWMAAQIAGVGDAGSSWNTLLPDCLLGGVVIPAVVLIISLVFDKILGKQSMGGGDIKLLFAVGLFLGFACSFLNLILACVLGIVFGIAFQAAGKGKEEEADESIPKKAFPFGPAIAAATWVTLLCGQPIVSAYFGLMGL